MNFLGNLIWLIFGGFISGLGYILGGLLVSLTVVGIPFGKQAIKLGAATMTPFGREIEVNEEFDNPLNLIFNIIWAILFGWEIAISHFVHGIILGITIVGIPFAKQHFKLIPLALFPFGRELR
ncbi:MAG: YccF domain-containing protein [Anaerolineales bacterium]|nr:YccF domain-containing protein [Chloroflexota bacterium]MBL7162678.1 YccF domain-containing protein [Anaerolineales bacterium]